MMWCGGSGDRAQLWFHGLLSTEGIVCREYDLIQSDYEVETMLTSGESSGRINDHEGSLNGASENYQIMYCNHDGFTIGLLKNERRPLPS